MYVSHISLKCIQICSEICLSPNRSMHFHSRTYIDPWIKNVLQLCSKRMFSHFSWPQYFRSIYCIIENCNKQTHKMNRFWLIPLSSLLVYYSNDSSITLASNSWWSRMYNSIFYCDSIGGKVGAEPTWLEQLGGFVSVISGGGEAAVDLGEVWLICSCVKEVCQSVTAGLFYCSIPTDASTMMKEKNVFILLRVACACQGHSPARWYYVQRAEYVNWQKWFSMGVSGNFWFLNFFYVFGF